MKILFCLPLMKLSGLEKVAIEYLEGLIQLGYQVDLIIDFDAGKVGNTLEYAIPKDVNFQYIRTEKIYKFVYYFRVLAKKYKIFKIFLYGFIVLFDFYFYHAKTKKILQKKQYDFTISFSHFSPSYLTQFKATKHIIWLHSSVEHFFGGIRRLFKNSYGKKLNKFDYIITTANEMRSQLKLFYPELPEEKIKMIYNPFNFNDIIEKSNIKDDLSKVERLLLNSDYICSVARLDEEQKDFTTLILAYSKLYFDKKIEDKLYIIGDGPSKGVLKNLVKSNGLEKQVLFLGEKINPFVWVKNAKLFVLSSKFEGFGLILVDAMAVNTFVISSNCKTGPKEILQNGECGDLFEVGDVDGLSDIIGEALLNDKYREGKILKASNRINEFNKANILTKLADILN